MVVLRALTRILSNSRPETSRQTLWVSAHSALQCMFVELPSGTSWWRPSASRHSCPGPTALGGVLSPASSPRRTPPSLSLPLSLNLSLPSISPPTLPTSHLPSPAQSIPGKVLEQYLQKGIRYPGGSWPPRKHRWLIPGQFWASLPSSLLPWSSLFSLLGQPPASLLF